MINTLLKNSLINLVFDKIRDRIQNLIKKFKNPEQEVEKN